MDQNRRNVNVELWRILFCIQIVGLHGAAQLGWKGFHAGYLGVEFFFMVSGYGIYRAYAAKGESKETIGALMKRWCDYATKRFLRLYPLYLCSILAMIVVRLLTGTLGLHDLISCVRNCIPELLMLQCGPFAGDVIVVANWYVAVLFWGSLIYYFLLLVFKKRFSLIFCPIAAILIYGYFAMLIGKIDIIVSYYAFLRGMAGLGLGILIAVLLEKIRMPGKMPAIIANIMLFCVLIYTHFGHRSMIDFVVTGVFFISLFIMFASEIEFPERIRIIITEVSGFTYPIYLFQLPTMELIKNLFYV